MDTALKMFLMAKLRILCHRYLAKCKRAWIGLDKRRLEEHLISNCSLFDRNWYLETYPDVKLSGRDPLQHFLRKGSAEGRDPSAYFSTCAYYALHADVERAGLIALTHYLLYGREEQRVIFSAKEGKALLTQQDVTSLRRLKSRFLPPTRTDMTTSGQNEGPVTIAEPLSFPLIKGPAIPWDSQSIFCTIEGLPQLILGGQVLGTLPTSEPDDVQSALSDWVGIFEIFCAETDASPEIPMHRQDLSQAHPLERVCLALNLGHAVSDGTIVVKADGFWSGRHLRLFQFHPQDRSRLALLMETDLGPQAPETFSAPLLQPDNPALLCVNGPFGELQAVSLLNSRPSAGVIIPKNHWVENWTSPAFDALGERDEEIEIHRKPDPDDFEAMMSIRK